MIVCGYWLMKRLGMEPFYAELTGKGINRAPAIAWPATPGLCPRRQPLSNQP